MPPAITASIAVTFASIPIALPLRAWIAGEQSFMTTAVTEMRQPAALAADMGVPAAMLEPYGDGVAKIKLEAADALQAHQLAKYVLMTAVTPTPFGEGKTVSAIGLGDGLRPIGRRGGGSLGRSSVGTPVGEKAR